MNDVATTEEEEQDDLLGEVVDDRFRLDKKLGEGAVGRVYEATQLSIERSVAIKVLHGEFRRDDEYQKRFQREARAISSFNHPNIVRLVDYGEDDKKGLTYLAMEFVEGLELFDIVEKGRLDPRCALEITSQVAAGLSAAHESDIVHRDLKASNIILVSVPGGIFQAKVLDFGVAFPKNQSTRMTTDGEVFGTPAYMSPEQARGKTVDAPSDIYSLGIVLFEMLAGRLPYDGDNTVELMVKHLQEEPPPLSKVLPAGNRVPNGLQSLLDWLLQKDPEERPHSGDAVRERIEEIRTQNDWGALHVDSHLGLEEALEKWILPEDDNRLTTEEETGRPGSERQHSLQSNDAQGAVRGAQQQGGGEAAPGSGSVQAQDPSAAGPGPSESQQARAAQSATWQTTHATTSIDRLKTAVVVLAVLLALGGGGTGFYFFYMGSKSGSGDGSSAGETPAAVGAKGGDAGARAAGSSDSGRPDTGVEGDTGGAQADATADAGAADKKRRVEAEETESSDEETTPTASAGGGQPSDEAGEPTGGTESTGGSRREETTSSESESKPKPKPEPEPKRKPKPEPESKSKPEPSGGDKKPAKSKKSKKDEDGELDQKLQQQLKDLDDSF